MQGPDIIFQQFPSLTDLQKQQFEQLYPLYEDWNSKINVISRKDFEFFYERHVLHSLGIAKVIRFQDGSEILDVGTGGGFPGIPLAILFPNSSFHLIDSIGKKIKVVDAVVEALDLKNVRTTHCRAEELKDKYDFVVSRAVTSLDRFLPWIRNKINSKQQNGYPNGLFYLKGGDLKEELASVKRSVEITDLSDYFDGEFFETKKVVYMNLSS